MCLIIFSVRGTIPGHELHHALVNNPDGWGFMIGTGRYLHIAKGLTTAEFWQEWRKRPKGPVIFHARIGTHGTKDIENCHPFWVTNRLAVAHNGVIHNVTPDEILSDTRVFIRDILRNLPGNFIEHRTIRKLIGAFIGYSKLAFMTHDGRVWIINSALGHKTNGRWYSNTSYHPYKALKPEPKKEATPFAPLDCDRRLPEYYRTLYTPYTHTVSNRV